MVKSTKMAITFFAMGGFLGILDMLFHATWPTVGVNAAWLTFFSTSKPNYPRLHIQVVLSVPGIVWKVLNQMELTSLEQKMLSFWVNLLLKDEIENINW